MTDTAIREGAAVKAGPSRAGNRIRGVLKWLLPLAPAVVLIGAFFVGPILWSVYVSFTDMGLTGRAAANPVWVGLSNYSKLATDSDAHRSIGLSLIYVVFVVAGQNALGLLLALMMRGRNKTVRAVTNAAVVCAWVMPEIVVAILWYAFLEPDGGTLNSILSLVGSNGQDWLVSAPMFAIIIASIWRGTAFSMLVYSAAVEEIPPDTIEASKMDGANGFQRLIFVILPTIKRMILTTLLLTTLQTVGVFGLIYALTAGGPNNQTETLPLFMFNEAFGYNLLGYGSAVALLLVALGAIISAIYLAVFRLKDES